MSEGTDPSQGPLTGHKVRFGLYDGRAGSYEPETQTYMVFFDEGYTRNLEISERKLEDLGLYESETTRPSNWAERSIEVECRSQFHEGEARTFRTSKQHPAAFCWKCVIAEARHRTQSRIEGATQ